MKTYEGFVYQNHNFSMFVHLLCQTKNTGSEMKKITKDARSLIINGMLG